MWLQDSCDLDLDYMNFIYELDLTILKMYPHTKNEYVRAFESDRIIDRQSDHTHDHAASRVVTSKM